MRWDIEVFFKCTKSLLRLQKEFQGRSYDLLISHTTIVFSRYILLAWQHRQSTDQRTIGGLFYLLCDEVGTLDWVVALATTGRIDQRNRHKGRKKNFETDSTSTPAMDCRFAQLHQGLFANFKLRKLSY